MSSSEEMVEQVRKVNIRVTYNYVNVKYYHTITCVED